MTNPNRATFIDGATRKKHYSEEAVQARMAPLIERLKALRTYFDLSEEELALMSSRDRADCIRQHRLICEALSGVAGERDEALELAQEAVEMTGEPDCWHDHNGRCQAHNLQPRGECWVERVKALTERKRDD